MMSVFRDFKQDFSLSAMVAGLLAVTISYAGPLVIFFQVAESAGIGTEMMTSWIWAVSIGSAIGSIVLSLRYKVPILLAWSIPGTALLVSLFPSLSLGEAVGAYLIAGLITLMIGMSGYFDKVLHCIPQGIAGGMMAGILFGFGLGAFNAFGAEPVLACSMLVVYLIAKRFAPRYAIVWVLLTGLLVAFFSGLIQTKGPFAISIAKPLFIAPEFSWQAVFNLALPLVILNLTGQFLPGMALIKLNNYQVSSQPIINSASLLSLAVAVFGGISIVLAAVTSALCMGKDCHENPDKRYIGGVFNGVFYLVGAVFAGSLVGLFAMLPKSLIAMLAGLALLGALLTNLGIAMQHSEQKEPALITFLVTASGMSLFGLSSVFWGIVFGMIGFYFYKPKHQKLMKKTK
ncbi:benzoate/H(+) symporter BenE family transporter [Moraxella nasibovis]|uniref:benzoate/H(+) symporter BenE family transporter n=1 Tax=Moraxella nasibovis TaxID=2904120 RepID=UPI00240FDD3B|nr:benzoate/H(+) symporter BenE family transporter [Moraxella nasibovis]WFF38488.1 benzoate/H(+) symporter BenE family transporter [Moraxella nasibovis]